jgi:signal transduction histidine kinase
LKTYSITRRLIVTVLLIELVSAICVTGVALVYERHTHFRAFDTLLRGRADSLLGAVQDSEDAADNVMLDGSEVSVPPDDIYEVRDDAGRLLGRSVKGNGLATLFSQSKEQVERRLDRDEGKQPHDPGKESFARVVVDDKVYGVIRAEGLRIVDPGDQNGGVRRYVTVYYGSSTERVWHAVWRSAGFYAISSLLVLLATGVLMSWLLNRGLAPLRELASAAGRVSVASWSFEAPEKARATKELAPLVVALEELLRGLELSFAQQQRFIGDAAHELKTSVAVVKSSLQLLGLKKRTAEEYEAGLARCLNDCERMEAIVAQMLTLARIEEGDSGTSGAFHTDFGVAIRNVVAQLETVAQARAINIAAHLSSGVLVDVDPGQLELMCRNIVLNAIEHSTAGHSVTVTLDRVGEKAQMKIVDTGEGIDERDLTYIFERFSRADPSRSRKTGGSGLGLAICKAISDKYRGTIEILSAPGEGTTVVVTFLSMSDGTPESATPNS